MRTGILGDALPLPCAPGGMRILRHHPGATNHTPPKPLCPSLLLLLRSECEQYAGDLLKKAKVDFNTQARPSPSPRSQPGAALHGVVDWALEAAPARACTQGASPPIPFFPTARSPTPHHTCGPQEEKEAVAEVFGSAVQCLAEEDRELPFIKAMLPMLQSGIAVHHSGGRGERVWGPTSDAWLKV